MKSPVAIRKARFVLPEMPRFALSRWTRIRLVVLVQRRSESIVSRFADAASTTHASQLSYVCDRIELKSSFRKFAGGSSNGISKEIFGRRSHVLDSDRCFSKSPSVG